MSIDTEDVAIGEWWVDIMSSVRIKVTNPEHILRAVNNHTDAGVPAVEGEKGWCDFYYGRMSVEEVMQHLAFNCAVNDVWDASRLDGWADLGEGQLTMHLDRDIEFERVAAPL